MLPVLIRAEEHFPGFLRCVYRACVCLIPNRSRKVLATDALVVLR